MALIAARLNAGIIQVVTAGVAIGTLTLSALDSQKTGPSFLVVEYATAGRLTGLRLRLNSQKQHIQCN